MKALDVFTTQYIVTALWSSTDDNDKPLDDDYSTQDISQECLDQMIADCAKFQAENNAEIHKCLGSFADNLSTAGHDFWLTRNGHGAGFWDGDWPQEVGERLTKASKAFGEFNLYVGDDGQIYGS